MRYLCSAYTVAELMNTEHTRRIHLPAAGAVVPWLLTLSFGLAAGLFFAFRYPYHLHYQEQLQLFQWTGSYLREVVLVPGGLADWMGRLLTQFFYHARVGAVLIGLLLVAIQRATWAHASSKAVLYPLSFIPAVLAWMYLCDENALMGAPIALLLALTASLPARGKMGWTGVIALLLYFVAGPMAIVFVLLTPLRGEDRRQRIGLLAIGMAALALALLLARATPYPMERLLTGIHYHRIPTVFPLWIGLSALAAVALPWMTEGFASRSTRHTTGGVKTTAIGMALTAGVIVLTWAGIRLTADFTKEEAMHYDFMVRMKMWNRTMQTADRKMPRSPFTVTCLNLALAQTERMADHQFEYFQNGPEGLLPAFNRDFTSPLPASEAYYYLGMVNTAQRYTFEAQEAITDFQKSARCYKRLAETNLINGDYSVARMYLMPLTHTLFYRQWARQTLALLGDEEAIERHPEYGPLRKMRYHEHDFFFSQSEMDSMLGLLCTECPDNRMALQYLMAWCLTQKDLKRFSDCLPLVHYTRMPRSYQEAFLLMWVQTHDSFSGLPPFIDEEHISRMTAFMEDKQKETPAEQMAKRYADTYWYYYLYRYNQK